jgi:hypothetical protein
MGEGIAIATGYEELPGYMDACWRLKVALADVISSGLQMLLGYANELDGVAAPYISAFDIFVSSGSPAVGCANCMRLRSPISFKAVSQVSSI